MAPEKGMTKQDLFDAYYKASWAGAMSSNPFELTGISIFFEEESVELLTADDESIYFVFDNVDERTEGYMTVWPGEYQSPGTGTLISNHLDREEAVQALVKATQKSRAAVDQRLMEIRKKQELNAYRKTVSLSALEAESERVGTQWRDATRAIVAGGIVASALYPHENEQKNESNNGFNASGTGAMNSAELGRELLNQKITKGISGKGKVVPVLPNYKVGDDPGKPIPGTGAPSIGYNPQDTARQNGGGQSIGYDPAFTIVPMLDAGLTCIYTNGDQAVAFMKSNGCPSSVNWPNEYSNEIFDMTQGGKIATSGVLRRLSISNSNSTNCAYYIQPDTYVLVPKGRGASCPSRMEL